MCEQLFLIIPFFIKKGFIRCLYVLCIYHYQNNGLYSNMYSDIFQMISCTDMFVSWALWIVIKSDNWTSNDLNWTNTRSYAKFYLMVQNHISFAKDHYGIILWPLTFSCLIINLLNSHSCLKLFTFIYVANSRFLVQFLLAI